MKKAIILGLVIVIIALGSLGVAFSRPLPTNWSVGWLAYAHEPIPEIQLDGVKYGVEQDDAKVYFVSLSFNADIDTNCAIGVVLTDINGNDIPGSKVWVDNAGFAESYEYVKITLPTPIPIVQIYDIEVIVANETGPGA
jgi:hypothetical protein